MTTDNANLITLDRAAIEALPKDQRFVQKLWRDTESTGKHCEVGYVRTPPGGGSPSAYHSHDVDQFVYVLEGVMTFVLDGRTFTAGPDSFITIKAGVPHQNRNDSDEPTLHLSINEPTLNPGAPHKSIARVQAE